MCQPVNISQLSVTVMNVRQAVTQQESAWREENYKCYILLRQSDRTAGASCRNYGSDNSFIKHAFGFVSLWDASYLAKAYSTVHELCLGAE